MVKASEGCIKEIPKHLDGLAFQETTGQLALISSNLTGRDWNGVLAVFDDAKFAPNIPHVDYGAEIDSGCTSVSWITETRLVTTTDAGSLKIWDMTDSPSLENSINLSEHSDICSSASVSRHTKQIVSGSWDNVIKLWDLEVDMSINSFHLHSEKVLDVKWDEKETNVFCSVSEDQTVVVYDNRKDEKPGFVAAKTKVHFPTCLEWIDSRNIAVGLSNGGISLYDLRNPKKELKNCHSHKYYVTKIQKLGDTLFSAGEDCKVYGHNIDSLTIQYEDKRHSDYVRGIFLNTKDGTVWSCGWDGCIYNHEVSENNVEKIDS